MSPSQSVIVLGSRGLAEIRGPDARDFLQGLVSNDVRLLAADRAIHAALLTPQGKYLFDFILYERDGVILLETQADRVAELVRRLLMYRLRAKVEIAEVPAQAGAVLIGGDAPARLGLAALPGAARPDGGLVVAVDPRHVELGVRLVGPEDVVAARVAAVGAAEAGPAAYDRLRIALAVPDGDRDMVVQTSTLLECNFDGLNGVAFDKGCFIGQELTARMKHRGLLKKRLVPVRVDGPLPAPGTPVMAGEREAGEIRSGVEGLALALLRLEQLGSGATLTAGGTGITPAPPPWMVASATT
jgi:folate-binding protein YgfZ